MHPSVSLSLVLALATTSLHQSPEVPSPAELAIRHHPGGPVYVRPLAPGRVDAVVHAVALVNEGDRRLSVEHVSVRAITGDGDVVSTIEIPSSRLASAAEPVAQLMAGPGRDYFRRVYGLDEMLPADALPQATPDLPPGQAMVIQQVYLVTTSVVDHLTVLVRARAEDGAPLQAEGTIPLQRYESPRTFRFPLDGTWFVTNASSPDGSHRWRPSEEFALDLARRDADGRSCSPPCATHDSYLAFGAPVRAVAAGAVVAVQSHVASAPLRGAGESEPEHARRFSAYVDDLRATDPGQLSGNFVTVDHGDGEFSYYGHLDTDSIPVAVGDRVEAGQVIGRLGHTGFSTSPHLHFQLMAGPDHMFSRSLPITFEDVVDGAGDSIRGMLRVRTFVRRLASEAPGGGGVLTVLAGRGQGTEEVASHERVCARLPAAGFRLRQQARALR